MLMLTVNNIYYYLSLINVCSQLCCFQNYRLLSPFYVLQDFISRTKYGRCFKQQYYSARVAMLLVLEPGFYVASSVFICVFICYYESYLIFCCMVYVYVVICLYISLFYVLHDKLDKYNKCCVLHYTEPRYVHTIPIYLYNAIGFISGPFYVYLNMRHLTIFKKYLNNAKLILILYAFIFQFIKNKTLTIGLLNPGSLGTRHEEFLVALERRSVDIMAINETWLREGEEQRAPSPPGYRLRHTPRPLSVRSRGGGVGFYIRTGISVRQVKPPQATTSVVEQMWLSLTLNGVRIVIGTAYRPPWLSVDTFLDALTESVSSFSKCDHIVILGDFNINLLSPSDPNTKKLNAFLHYSNLTQYVASPTHFTDHSETLIDLVCSTIKVSNLTVDIIPDLSHHAFITCTVRLNKPKPLPRWVVYRPLKDIDLKEFNALVNTISWERLLTDDINADVLAFNAYILHVFDMHAPLIKSRIKQHSYPWITPTVREMMKLRDEAYVKSRSTNLETDIVYYKELKSIVNKALYTEKKAYFDHNINLNSNNSKQLWKNIKNNVVDFNKRDTNLPPDLLNPNLLNDHFLNVPGKNDVSISDLTYFEYHRFSPAHFSFTPVDEASVLNIIMNITSNAEGVDGITRNMILLTLPRTLGVITSMINSSLRNGVFPDIWKESIVKPIPKKVSPNVLNDLRPISILPFLSKVTEKVVCQQVTRFLDSNSILPSKQSGFRAGRSTATALLDIIDDILAGEDVGEGSILVLLDFSRAFDTINHNLLLSKLSYYGFNNEALKWFTSYLGGRSQFVQVCDERGNKINSKTVPLTRGIPQGSILGPILFILYSANLTDCINNCNHHIYADDLQIYFSFKPTDTLIAVDKINDDLERIQDWANRNCLVLNPKKSKCLILGSRAQIMRVGAFDPIIRVGDATVDLVSEARNLGVLMDSNLKFHNHVLETVRNCYYRLKVLYRVREFLDVDLRIRLCETLILSKLNYADTVTGECLFGYTKNLIQRVQNACARFCFSIPRRAHVTPFLNQGNLMNMKSRRSLHFACLLFGIIRTKTPSYLYDKLSFSQRQVRFASRLVCPGYRSAAFRGSFRYAATKCWNNIPPPFRKLTAVSTFKFNFKKYLLNLQKSNQ